MKARVVSEADEKTDLEQERDAVLGGIETGGAPFLEATLIQTTRTFLKAGKEIETNEKAETLTVRDFLVPPARVGVEIGQTLNMGNYESLRITINAQVPCYTEEMAEAYDHVVAFTRDRLVAERKEAVAWAKSKGAENLF